MTDGQNDSQYPLHESPNPTHEDQGEHEPQSPHEEHGAAQESLSEVPPHDTHAERAETSSETASIWGTIFSWGRKGANQFVSLVDILTFGGSSTAGLLSTLIVALVAYVHLLACLSCALLLVLLFGSLLTVLIGGTLGILLAFLIGCFFLPWLFLAAAAPATPLWLWITIEFVWVLIVGKVAKMPTQIDRLLDKIPSD